MVSTLVCRTCLYVGDTGFSFKKLDKVKSVLEMFMPEIKNCFEKSSPVCEQCYYFLKNVEKFKAKCLDTQQKLYSMNVDSIRKERESIIQNSKIVNRNILPVRMLTVTSKTFMNNRDITKGSIEPKKNAHLDDEFRVTMDVDNSFKSLHTNVQLDDDIYLKNEEDDGTRSSLLEEAAIANKSTEKDSATIGIIEVSSDEDDVNSKQHTAKIEFCLKKSLGHKPITDNFIIEKASVNNPDLVQVKTEPDENPGFFNKKSKSGFYKCKMCIKRYKTSEGLYNHTKTSHREQLKFYHCQYCSFFTLWKSALTRHRTVYHENNILHSACPQCKFVSRSQDQLNRHILENHVYETFTRCTLCRARFTHKIAFMEHIKNEHVNVGLPGTLKCSHFCSECSILFLSLMDYRIHLAECHNVGLVLCDKCNAICNNKEEYYEHNDKVHGSPSSRVGMEDFVSQPNCIV